MTSDPAREETPDVLLERQLTKDERDPAELAAPLTDWLGDALGADGPVELREVVAPSGSGMSSVTLVLACVWSTGGVSREQRLVARIPPASSNYPVFPTYDLRAQYDVMAAVRAGTDVPVPRLVGIEETGSVLGRPFLVMEGAEGRAPTDNPPYVFGGWLYDATPEQRATVEEETLRVIAGVHELPPTAVPWLTGTADALRAHVDGQRAYYAWTHRLDGVRIPLLERAFDWLEDHWPARSGPAVPSWGDARPGNILFDDEYRPTAVLDWEMATFAPRELDVAWYIFVHRFFQDIAQVFELPGLPDLAQPGRVSAIYEGLTGHRLRDLQWYIVYAALRQGIVMAQIKRRMVHFGEEQRPADPDDYVMHRAAIEELIG
jgi:aminoglycoside phosphotransferase (APT) family kinase protein